MKKITAVELLGTLILIAIEVLLLGWFLMLLWNHNIPEIFPGVNTITYPQGIGLYGLCRLMFTRPSVD